MNGASLLTNGDLSHRMMAVDAGSQGLTDMTD